MSAADDALTSVLETGRARAAALGPSYQLLWDSLADACTGGRRFRPALLARTHEALGGRLAGPVAEVAAAVELLHAAFVIHDDVIDRDDIRRGRPNVSGTFAATAAAAGAGPERIRAYADTAGILAGDLALVAAARTVASCGAPASIVESLLDLLETTVHATAAGELADVELGLGLTEQPLPLGEIITVGEHKTAVYSFQLPLQAGALLAGADDDVVDALREVGRLLGIGFQLVDDLKGVFGEPDRTGKDRLGDLREGKYTALIAHARSTSAWSALAPLVGDRNLDEAGAAQARALLTSCGSRRFVHELATDYLAAATRRAAEADLPLRLVERFAELGEEILDDLDPAPRSSASRSRSHPAAMSMDA
ncbi:polyprenyl synthetase family protein [Pseudactinotalea terrae]|uniref:polyprenyl synthetase family protein n=1 Tax=Pseudactinotalea terrae TaxID=1743262 RepID=UPI0012E161C1|nr:polyprenyl synthetase family protein [Pseudactinotalea terrae]